MDAWRLGGATSSWTYVGGAEQPSADPVVGWPPNRNSGAMFQSADGTLYIFAGITGDSGGIRWTNAVWRCDGSGTWTRVWGDDTFAGVPIAYPTPVSDKSFSPSNAPGARYSMASWSAPDGTFYIHGGSGMRSPDQSIGFLGDTWRFDPNPGPTQYQWAFVGGTTGYNCGQPASQAGCVTDASTWIGKDGNLYLFGGSDGSGGYFYYASLWRFCLNSVPPCSASTYLTWELVKGPLDHTPAGVYGIAGVSASDNNPGGRMGAAHWSDTSGRFWLFGGFGMAEAGNPGPLNDLWAFDGSSWTWVGGSKTVEARGSYGAVGVTQASNWPPSRYLAAAWAEPDGTVLLFGGNFLTSTLDPNSTYLGSIYGDLWRWRP